MTKPRTMAGRKMVSLPPESWEKVEDFRFGNRIKTESEAIRRLVERGLTHDEIADIAEKAMRLLGRSHVLDAMKEPERERYELLFSRWMDQKAEHIEELRARIQNDSADSEG